MLGCDCNTARLQEGGKRCRSALVDLLREERYGAQFVLPRKASQFLFRERRQGGATSKHQQDEKRCGQKHTAQQGPGGVEAGIDLRAVSRHRGSAHRFLHEGEDIGEAEDVGEEQHQKHEYHRPQDIAARRGLVELLGQLHGLVIAQRSDALLGIGR